MGANIQFPNLEIEIVEEDEAVFYRFKGDVDENFQHSKVTRVKKDKLILELGGIRLFNSCGIREWIYFMRDMAEHGSLIFRECSVAMIDQINLVPDSLSGGVIESLYAPYFCECRGEVNKLIRVSDFRESLTNKVAPNFPCKKCGKDLEFDALEESYFLFANSTIPKVG